jgi:predicted amidohydrolase
MTLRTTRRDLLLLGASLSAGEAALAEDVGRPRPAQSGVATSSGSIAPYLASCVASRVRPVFDKAGAFIPDAREANLQSIESLIAKGRAEVGSRLYAFPEFALQPAPRGANVAAWEQAAIEIPGPETERISRMAQKANAFIALSAAERIPAFPGRYFLSGLILGPNGNVVLNYRKLYDLTNKSRPSDLLPAWIEKFGPESLFPVADTDIGRLACAVALDVNWPEMVRGFVFKGAEIIINPTASPAMPGGADLDIRLMVRRVRAFENMAYVLLPNLGPVDDDSDLAQKPRLPSEIIDFNGAALAHGDREGFLNATIDIESLRRARTAATGKNWLAQLQIPLHAPAYQNAVFSGVNGWPSTPLRDAKEHTARLQATISGLVTRGVLKAPGEDGPHRALDGADRE